MGGKAHGGRRVKLSEAKDLFEKIQGNMPVVSSLILCGSARRGKAICGDLDIVVVPASGTEHEQALDNFFVSTFGRQKSGKPGKNGLIDGVQVEFYVASPENVGSFVQMWTGSKRENIRLRKIAKKKGFSLSQYGCKSIETGECFQFKKEEDVYHFLEENYKIPKNR